HDVRIWHDDIRKAARLDNWDLNNPQITSSRIVFSMPQRKRKVLPLNVDGYFDPADITGQKPVQGFSRLHRPYERVRVWHMGILVAALDLGIDMSKAKVDLARGRIVLPLPNGRQRVLPVNKDGELLIDWTLRRGDPRLTSQAFEAVIADGILRLQGSFDKTRFLDKLVFVGSTALGSDLSDRGATPLEKDTFLTSSHWNVASSMITGRFVRVAPPWMDFLLVCVFGAAGSFFACKFFTARASVSVASLGAIYVAAATAAQIFARWWMPLVTPLLALAAGYVTLLTYQAFFEETEKRRVKDIFSR